MKKKVNYICIENIFKKDVETMKELNMWLKQNKISIKDTDKGVENV